ncbi:MAG: phosphate ABC transporter permease subunit PstC [Nitriliruptorales bacterium]
MTNDLPPELEPDSGPLASRGSGRHADTVFRGLVTAAGVSVLLVLGLMIASTTADAWPVFVKEGFGFLTGRQWKPGPSRTEITGTYGALPFIYGTITTSVIALTLALPLSIGVALYLSEVAPRSVRRPLSYAVELLAAVPSVVYGLWGVLFFIPIVLLPLMRMLSASLGGWLPILAGPPTGFSHLSAGTVLAIMVLPIITAIIREVFTAVPQAERDAAYALGATRWEVMRHVVLPRTTSGIVGASMLGLGRALGETIAVALLIGSAASIDVSVMRPGYSMAALIANTFQESSPEGVQALVAIGVALFVITIVVNAAARFVVWKVGNPPAVVSP